MKNYFALLFTIFLVQSNAQEIGGYIIQDYLVSSENSFCPEGNDSYIIGYPSDSSYVNFNAGDFVIGHFENEWIDGDGIDLVVETSYHPSNYTVQLIFQGEVLSDKKEFEMVDWTALETSYFSNYLGQGNCAMDTWPGDRFIYPVDFDADFGLTSSDLVIGIKVTFKTTTGSPDIAGVYITDNALPCAKPELGPDTTICTTDILILDPGSFGSYYWPIDGSTNSTFTFDGSLYSPGSYSVEVETCDQNNCCKTDTVLVDVTICSSIIDVKADIQLEIFPNPFDNSFEIKSTDQSILGKINVYDPYGNSVISSFIGSPNYTMNTTDWPAGVYIIEIGSYSRKIIKRPQ